MIRLFVYLTFAAIWLSLGYSVAFSKENILNANGVRYRIDRDTLEIAADFGDGKFVSITSKALGLSTKAEVIASTLEQELVITVKLPANSAIKWPITGTSSTTAFAIPIGEGAYVPAKDKQWLDWLKSGSSGALSEQLTMPFWTVMNSANAITWIVETPIDGYISFAKGDKPGQGLVVSLTYNSPLPSSYKIRIVPSGGDPTAGAKAYRKLLQRNKLLPTLKQKIARVPEIAKLGGAPFIYLWGKGPLKSEDIRDWRGFVTKLCAGKIKLEAGGIVTELCAGRDINNYDKKVLTRAVNDILRQVIPLKAIATLAGNHDPQAEVLWAKQVRQQFSAAFGQFMIEPQRWGGGLSLDTVNALLKAGIKRAWLGVENWNDGLWHLDAVEAAKAAGYLVATYDSYNTAILPTHDNDSWQSARMGQKIAETGGYRRQDGTLVKGFRGNGVYINPVAVEDYAHQRISAIATAARLNSYFLDVDGTGLLYPDYTKGRHTSKTDDFNGKSARLAFVSNDLKLVTGTETGMALFAPVIAFSHGITTPYFAWRDKDMRRNRQSPYWLGGYWPPETPSLFFKPTPLKPEIARHTLDPQFRLPLYQIALHDSVITSHHWINGSLKFKGWRSVNGLIQLLYMTPPLYHLSTPTLKRDLPTIAAYHKLFSPLHRRLFNQPMTEFSYLTKDRLVQRSSFGNGTTITVNFSDQNRQLQTGINLPGLAAVINEPNSPSRIVELKKIVGQ